MGELSVYLDGYPFDIRPHSSDVAIVQELMPQISRWSQDIRLVLQKSLSTALRANYKILRTAIGWRLGKPLNPWAANTDYLNTTELARSHCDMVFSHRGFPLNCGDHPVIWMNAVVNPEMVKAYYGLSQDELDEEVEVKGKLFKKAAAVQVCSEAEALRHTRTYPKIADRFVPVPMFLPYLQAVPETVLEKHRNARPVKLLFVGNQPLVKGLPELLEAYRSIPQQIRKETSLTIVSHFDRGRKKIKIPNDPEIIVHPDLQRADLLDLMRDSHILVNVAHSESYGFVFPEAMSRGMLCLGPDWEVQRELLDEGRAGMNLRCDVDLLRSALLKSIEDEDYRIDRATAGLRRFNGRYAPAVVAAKYTELFRAVGNRRHRNGAQS